MKVRKDLKPTKKEILMPDKQEKDFFFNSDSYESKLLSEKRKDRDWMSLGKCR